MKHYLYYNLYLLYSANHGGSLNLIICNSLLQLHLFTHRIFHLLLLFVFSNHQIILSDLLHLLPPLYLAHPLLPDLPLKDPLAHLCMQLVSLLLLLVLLLLETHQLVTLLLVGRLQHLLLGLTPEEGRSSIVMDLHHLVLLDFHFLLLFLEFFIL